MKENYQNLKDKITREEARREFYTKMGQRLGDKELFILMYLANHRTAVEKVRNILPDSVDETYVIDIDASDTIANIATSIKTDYQFVRKAIYALSLMGLVVKNGMKNNAQSWLITREGGLVLNYVIELEDTNLRNKSLTERYKEVAKNR